MANESVGPVAVVDNIQDPSTGENDAELRNEANLYSEHSMASFNQIEAKRRNTTQQHDPPGLFARLSATGARGHHATARPAHSAAATAKLTLHLVLTV
jgi:hypothetical protein